MRRTVLMFGIIVLASLAAQGQVRVTKILKAKEQPKRTIPSTIDLPTVTPNSAGGNSATPAANRTGVVDDAFTWFEAVSTEELGKNNIPYSTGWVLKSHLRVFGDYPNRSAIKLVVSKAGKAVATTRCETDSYHKTANDLDESYLWTNECWRKDTATKVIGDFDVQVFAVNGDTDEEKLVRTYKIDVRTVNRVKSGQEPGNGPPHYYIPRLTMETDAA